MMMMMDLNLPLMNVSSSLAAAQVDGSYRMEPLEDGSSPHWAAFPGALGGQVGVFTLVKMLWQRMRKPWHFWTAQAQKWLLKALQLWPGLGGWSSNQETQKDHAQVSSSEDPEKSLLEGGFNTYNLKAEMVNPGSQTITGGQHRQEEAEKTEKRLQMEESIMAPKLHLCTNPTLLSILCGPVEEEAESEDEEDEAPNSAIEIDGSAPSDTENTWSDEEESADCWDLDDENRALWDSFCNSTDPYNPLSFSSRTRSQAVATATEPQEPQQGGRTGTSDHFSLCMSTALPEPEHGADTQMPQQGLESSCRIKKVRFSPTVIVHHMRTWTFAHRMARRGPWEEMARDRCRFQKRIAEVEAAIAWCLEPRHRVRVQGQEQLE